MKVKLEFGRYKKPITKVYNNFSENDIKHLLVKITKAKSLNEALLKVSKKFLNTGGATFDGGFQIQGDFTKSFPKFSEIGDNTC